MSPAPVGRVVLGLALLATAACGPAPATSEQDGTDQSASASPLAIPTSSPTSTGPTAPHGTSVPDQPSPGQASPGRASPASPATATATGEDVVALAGQFTAFLGAGAPGDCDDRWWDEPLDVVPYVGLPDQRTTAVLGSVDTICLVGFDLARPVEVGLLLPDGTLREVTVDLTGDGRPVDLLGGPDVVPGFGVELETTTEGSVTWWIRPETPPGTYVVGAIQGQLGGTSEFALAPGTEAFLTSVPSPDPTIRWFAASGFPPGPAPFGIYRDTGQFVDDRGQVFELFTDLGVVEIDASGAAVIQVPVAGLPSGQMFCLESPLLLLRCAGGHGSIDPDYIPWG